MSLLRSRGRRFLTQQCGRHHACSSSERTFPARSVKQLSVPGWHEASSVEELEEDERELFLDPRAPPSGRAMCWPSARLLGPESLPAPGSAEAWLGVACIGPCRTGGSSVSAPTAHGDHSTQWAAASRILLGRLPHETLYPARLKDSCPARSRHASPGVSIGTEQTAVSP